MPVFQDASGLDVTCASLQARDAYQNTLEGYLANRNDTAQRLKLCLVADAEFCMAYMLRGTFAMLAFKADNLAFAQKCLSDAQRFSAGVSVREKAHVAALGHWVSGNLDATMHVWAQIVRDHPQDILAFRLHHFLGFWLGRPEEMLALADFVSPFYADDMFGAGAVHACRAFAHEESGSYAIAENCGWRAIDIDAGDIWAAHAVAHVYEMQARRSEGLRLFEALKPHWAGGNNLLHHLWWHQAMFHLERGESDGALALYDEQFRNLNSELTLQMPDLYIDMQNAISMLWRLEQQGVNGGGRWSELADKAEARKGDCSNPFTLPHLMIALLRDGRLEQARDYALAVRAFAASGHGTLNRIVGAVAAPVCDALLADASGQAREALDLMRPALTRLHTLGGSHAQQDLLHQVFKGFALRAGSRADLELIAERVRARRSLPLSTFVGWRDLAVP
jgi:hypothetical protein